MINSEFSSQKSRNLFIFLISMASFMGTLDSTIVNISLPTIAEFFQTGISLTSWILMIYYIVLSSLLIACGRLADLKGYKKIFIAGFILFTIASMLAALSPSLYILLIFRAIQATGASMLLAIGGAMITRYLPHEIRGRALGSLSTSAALGIAAGPIIGGFLTEFFFWQAIFLINIPVGIVGVYLGQAVIPRDKKITVSKPFFDLPGAVLLFITLGSFIFSISSLHTYGLFSLEIGGSILIFLTVLVIFLYREQVCPDPLIRLHFFRNIGYDKGNLGIAGLFFLYAGSSFLLPFYFERTCHYSTDISGLFMAIPAVAILFMARFAGILSDRTGSRIPCVAGILCYMVAFLLYSLFDAETPVFQQIGTLAIAGIGIGLYVAPNFRLIMSYASAGFEGLVSSTAMTVRYIGAVSGIAFFSAIFGLMSGKTGIQGISDFERISGFHGAFIFGFFIAIITLLITWFSEERHHNQQD